MAKTRTSFQEGNQAAKKLKTDEMMLEAYKQYCQHIASGKSKESWYLINPDITLTWRTMEKYIRENPAVLQPLQKEAAECASLAHWEKLGNSMMLGDVKGAQPAIFQMFMRNKFGWDKETNINHSVQPEFLKFMEKVRDQ